MKYDNIPWLSEESYAKARWQYKTNVRELLKQVFDQYGLGVFIDGTVDEIWQLTEDWGLRLRSIDKPISLDYVRRKKK